MASVADLQKFAAQVEEAQKLLANKAKVEGEIRHLEKVRDRVAAEVCEAEDHLAATLAKIASEEARYQHEKARYQIDLDAHVAGCAAQKGVAEKAVVEAESQSRAAIRAHADKVTSEKRKLDAELASLLSRRNHLANEISDFKRRISALPE